jgi:hypothetical protein
MTFNDDLFAREVRDAFRPLRAAAGAPLSAHDRR